MQKQARTQQLQKKPRLKRWVLVVILIALALTITFMVIYIPPLFTQKEEEPPAGTGGTGGTTQITPSFFDEDFEGYSADTTMAVSTGRPSPNGVGTWYVMNQGTGVYGDTIFYARASDDSSTQGQITGNIRKWNAITSYWCNLIYNTANEQTDSSSGSMGFDINIRTGFVNGNGFVVGWSNADPMFWANGIMKVCITPGNDVIINRGASDSGGISIGLTLLIHTTYSFVFTKMSSTTFSVAVNGVLFNNNGNGYPTIGSTNYVIGEFIWTWGVATTGQVDIDNIWTSWNQ